MAHLKVLFEDNHLVIVDKPAGLVTHGEGSVQEILKKQIGRAFVEPIHRLDKPVCGVLVFAKSSKALKRMMTAHRTYQKTYIALLDKRPKKAEGVLRHKLLHGDFRAVHDRRGKESLLSYTMIGPYKARVELHTGRYHQIRAQFAAIGCPIVGDRKYGSKKPYKKDAIALCHKELELTHPVTHETLVIQSSAVLD